MSKFKVYSKILVTEGRKEKIAEFYVKDGKTMFSVDQEEYYTSFAEFMLTGGAGPVKNSYKKMLRESKFKFKSIIT